MKLHCAIIRGGTSKGLFVKKEDLNNVVSKTGFKIDDIIRRLVLGRTDISPGLSSYANITGLGSGNSSTSKFVIVSRLDDRIDLKYEFAQILPSGEVDWRGTCGNLVTAVPLFAYNSGIINDINREISIWSESASQEFRVKPCDTVFQSEVDGLSGKAFNVEFLGQARNVNSCLPTGNAIDFVAGEEATLLLGANPTIFIRGINKPWTFQKIEDIRISAARLMGIDLISDLRVAFVDTPSVDEDVDLNATITTPGRLQHHAFTSTGLVNLAAASRIPGTIPYSSLRSINAEKNLRIKHPSGIVSLNSKVIKVGLNYQVHSVSMIRTARVLISGDAFLE